MNSDFSKMSGEERAVRLTAFALGELSPAEMEEVRQVAATDPVLARELEQLRQTIGLIQETTALDLRVSSDGVPLRMEDARRQALLKTFKTPAPRRVRRKRELWHVPMSIAAALVGLLVLAAGWPMLSRSKARAQRMSGLTSLFSTTDAELAPSSDASYSRRSDAAELAVEVVRKKVDSGAGDVRPQISAEAGTAPSYTLPGGHAVAHGSDVSGSRVVFSDSGMPLPTPPVDRNVSPATAKNTMTVVLPSGTDGNGNLVQGDGARPLINSWDEKREKDSSGQFSERELASYIGVSRKLQIGGANVSAPATASPPSAPPLVVSDISQNQTAFGANVPAPIVTPPAPPTMPSSGVTVDPVEGLKDSKAAMGGRTWGIVAVTRAMDEPTPRLETTKANDHSRAELQRESGSATKEIDIRYMVTDLDSELAQLNKSVRANPVFSIQLSPDDPSSIALKQLGATFQTGKANAPSPDARPSPKQDGYNVNVADISLPDDLTANSPKGGSVFSANSVGYVNVPPQTKYNLIVNPGNSDPGWFDASTSGQTTPRLENGRPAAEPEQPRPAPAAGGNSGGGGRSGIGPSFAQVSITGGGGQEGEGRRGPEISGDTQGRLTAGGNFVGTNATGDIKNRANIQLPVFGRMFGKMTSSDRESSPTRPNFITAGVRAVNDEVNEGWSGKRPGDDTITIIPDGFADRLKTGDYVENGKALLELGRLSDAEAQLKKAIERDPADKTASYYLDLVQGNQYGAESRKRERSSKEMLMFVEKEWQVPNTYTGTKLVQTSPNIDPAAAAAGPAANPRNPIADATPLDTSIVTAGTAIATTTNAVMATGYVKSPLAFDWRLGYSDGSLAGLADISDRSAPVGKPGKLNEGSGSAHVLKEQLAQQNEQIRAKQRELDAIKDNLKISDSEAAARDSGSTLEPEVLRKQMANLIEGKAQYEKINTAYTKLKSMSRADQKKALPVAYPDPALSELIQNEKAAQQKLTDLAVTFSAEHPEVKRVTGVLQTVNKQIEETVDGVLLGVETRVAARKAEVDAIQKAVDAAKELDIQKSIEPRPYFLAKRDLEALQLAREQLNMQIAAQEVKIKPADPTPAKPTALAPIPQPEIQTRDNAFSTFSLNVADVSFKLAAASLERGAMPDLASIRSEEFINAFDYRDPLPAAGVPVSFAWERARYPFAQNRDALRFSIKTAAQGRDGGKPLNLVLLLDNSGSMERADRVQIIQESLRTLAAQLKPQDKISVVTFARTATLRVDGATGAQADEVAKKIGALTPEGGTNLEDALDLAYRTALRHYAPTAINRVVLLTDGAANLGRVEPKALKAKVEGFRKQGVALDCFGIGWEGFNDDLLEQLSRNGDGRYGFINEPGEAGPEFAAQLAGALQVAASDVKVQVQFNPKRVTAYRQVGYAKHQLTKEQFRDNKVDAAEIGASEAGNAVYVIETNPHGEGPVATVRVRFRVPQTDDYREHEWVVPFGSAVELEKSSPAMRLAAAATAFSESLASSPFAAEVRSDRLLGILSGVPEVYGADPRPRKLEWMVRQAKSISGK